MALVLADRVLETTPVAGTGDANLSGAVTGYQPFSVIGGGNTTYYTIVAIDDQGAPTGDWEVGIGTYITSGNKLQRDTVLSSSNGGALVYFASGTKQVFLDLPSEEVLLSAGDVNGPASAVNNNFALFDGTTGKLLKDAGINASTFATAAQGAKADTAVQPGSLGSAAYLTAGAANGVATLDSGGKVPVSQIPQMGDLNYQGTWNATTNTPILTSSAGTKGFYYVVSVAGNTNLNGITDWKVGDWAVFNGSVWEKIDNTDAVTSVNGYTGTVVLTASDVGAQPSGTYVTSVSATSPVTSTGGTTPTIAMPAATTSVSGYLTSTDWNTFNGKGSGSVTSVSGTGTVSGISLSGTVTTTGSLTLGGTLDLSSPPTIGNTTANTITGTTITASTAYKGTYYDANSSAGGSLRTSGGTACFQWGAGGGNNCTVDGSINMNGSNAHIDMSPTGTGHVSINPTGVGDINNVIIGATTPLAGKFTSLTATGTTTLATSLTGLTKLTSGVVSTATSGTDYAPATSGTSILYGNGSGGFSNVTIGTGVSFAGGTLSATGSGGTVTSVTGTAPVVSSGGTTPAISMAAATTSVSGYLTSTDWNTFNGKAPATSGSSILYGNGAGGFSNVTVGTGLSFSTGTLSATGAMTYPGAGIANSTGSAWGTSYSTTGSGTVVALATSPSLTTPTIGSAGANFSGSTSGTIALKATATAGTNTITLPALTGTVAIQTAPQTTVYTTGSGTYTVPTGALYLYVKIVGGGGGGAGSSSGGGTGGTGGTSSFGSSNCSGGTGGVVNNALGGAGGVGTISGATGLAIIGGMGTGGVTSQIVGAYPTGGAGGNSAFGGGGSGAGSSNTSAGAAGAQNTGGGGGGANCATAQTFAGAGGGAGGYVDMYITSLSSTYSYAVGAGGTGGTAGTSGFAGGAGGSGAVFVTAYFN